MKKYFIILILFVSLSVHAQFNTGSIYFTGLTGANLGLQIEEGTTSIPYNLNVEGGYFIKNRLSLGGNFHSHGEMVFGTSGNHEIFIGPAVRYYLARIDGLQVYFYGNPFASLTTGFNRYGIAGGAGINYFITDRIALEARGLYRYYRNTSPGFGFNTQNLGFEAGISIFFPSIGFFDGIFRQSEAEEKPSPKKEETWGPGD